MNPINRSTLRLATLAVLACAALSAQADVLYSFTGRSFDSIPFAFSFTTSTYILSTTTVSSFATSTGLSSVVFDYTGGSIGGSTIPPPDLQIRTPTGGTYYFYYVAGNFSTPGTYTSTGNIGTLTVANPVPEPASFAALGLGAVAFLRRRKRA